MRPGARWILMALVAASASGAERPPLEVAVPLAPALAASDSLLRSARESGQGYLIDLAAGNDGIAFRAKPALTLVPGRYRLHVLAAAGPASNTVVDPVELTLTAGPASRRILPREIPKSGDLAEFVVEFAMTNEGPVALAMTWAAGDSLLEVSPQEKYKAFQNMLARRKAEILKSRQSAEELSEKPPETDELGAEDERPAALEVIAKATTPKYRLAIAGMHVEALCPVGIESAQTDKAAYEAGDAVKVEVKLRNFSRSDVQVELAAELVPADKQPGGPQGEHQATTVSVPAAGTLTCTFPKPWSTQGLEALARIPVRVSSKDSRPATAEALFAMMPPKRPAAPLQKKIFAHYMGCWPAGTGPIFYQRQTEGNTLKHDGASGSHEYFGGHVRNFDLLDPARRLTPEESADLEIRRAIRIGIDGFAIDAWAGDKTARETFDTLIKVAEAKDYPFEITVCIDPVCGGSIVGTVKEILAKHGKSPKLARRNGEPLIFGYQSVWTSYGHLQKFAPDRVDAMRASPVGWHIMGQALAEAARQVGQPVYYHYCMSYFFLNVDKNLLPKDALPQAAGVIGRYAGAVGGFGWLGPDQPAMAKAVRAAGAEWSMPVGMYQKENIPFECYVPKGTDWMHWGKAALEQDATLLQLITWNDYGENTCVAPAYNTRYTLYDLTGYEIALWKTGKEPAPDHDRIYLVYRKYPPGAKIFPFHAKFGGIEGGVIEVLTILPKPATVRLPGRPVEYEAPAGFHRQQFPVTAGPMIAELVRNGKVALRLESPEPITDKPFREDNGLVCWSSEEERLWKEDFGTVPPFWYSEYGDADSDELPNWFEMYWFSKERGYQPKANDQDLLDEAPAIRYSRWLDFTTATFADPKADPNGDGKANLENYRSQTDPTRLPPPGAPSGDMNDAP